MVAVTELSTCQGCGDDFYTEDLNAEMVCRVCEFGCDEPMPESMTISPSGTVATCWICGYKSGLWECGCDLKHDCETGEKLYA